ncbi:MAG: hypothetical protein IK082_01850 [Oscillospiraceae bacterium]|nr:hypothetical protein [Oscillospiraceae bacterium]
MDDLVRTIEDGFSERYFNFKEFQTEEKFRPLWSMCIETVKNRDSMTVIVFCNDTYKMPPVRVFIDINREKLDVLKNADPDELFTDGKQDKQFKTYVKQCLGAFWGMVFKFGLGYADRRTVSVVQKDYYGVATASRFVRDPEAE